MSMGGTGVFAADQFVRRWRRTIAGALVEIIVRWRNEQRAYATARALPSSLLIGGRGIRPRVHGTRPLCCLLERLDVDVDDLTHARQHRVAASRRTRST